MCTAFGHQPPHYFELTGGVRPSGLRIEASEPVVPDVEPPEIDQMRHCGHRAMRGGEIGLLIRM